MTQSKGRRANNMLVWCFFKPSPWLPACDGDNIVEELSAAGTSVARYAQGPAGHIKEIDQKWGVGW
jgi:hypothetical protein